VAWGIALNLSFGPAKPGATEGLANRGLGPLQKANAWLIVAIGAYLTLSGTLGVI